MKSLPLTTSSVLLLLAFTFIIYCGMNLYKYTAYNVVLNYHSIYAKFLLIHSFIY